MDTPTTAHAPTTHAESAPQAIKAETSLRHQTGTFQAEDGVELFEQSWYPAGEAHSVLLIIHGISEHSTRYDHIGRYFAERGFAVYTYDQRGHGRSQGDRSFIQNIEEYVTDATFFMQRVQERQPGKAIYLFGHSMGGLIATYFTAMRQPPIKALLLSGPAIKLKDEVPGPLVPVVRLIGKVAPRLAAVSIDATAVSHDPIMVEAYDNDPYVYRGRIPVATAVALFDATQTVQANLNKITVPLLVMHGTGDEIVLPEASEMLYANAGSKDKTLKLYDGLYHEILNEPERNEIMADMMAWMVERGAGSSAA